MPESDEIALATVEAFCQTRVPEQHRDELRLECIRRGNAITVLERRAPWNPDLPGWTGLKVAQLRFDPASRRWSLYRRDSNERWWPYEDVKPTASIDVLLADLDVDPTGIFWG